MNKYNSIQKYLMNLVMFSEMLNALNYQKLTEKLRKAESQYVLDNTSHLKYIDWINQAWNRFMSEPEDTQRTMVSGMAKNIAGAYEFLRSDFTSIDKLEIERKEETKNAIKQNMARLEALLRML